MKTPALSVVLTMDPALYDEHLDSYGLLVKDWSHDRSKYWSDSMRVREAKEKMPSADECRAISVQRLIKHYILAGLPFDHEEEEAIKMYRADIENPYELAVFSSKFAENPGNRTEIEELMLNYSQSFEEKAHLYLVEFLREAFPENDIVRDHGIIGLL